MKHEEFGVWTEVVLEVWAGLEFDVGVVVREDEDELLAVLLDLFEVEWCCEEVGQLRATAVVIGGGDEDREVDRSRPVELEGAKRFSSAETVTDDRSVG